MYSKLTKGIDTKRLHGTAQMRGMTNGARNGRSGKAVRTHDGEKRLGKIITIAVLCFLVFGVFAVLTYQSQQRNTMATDALGVEPVARNVQSAGMEIKETVHNPIHINGNSGFTSANGVTGGSGTQTDPYIIENWEIDGHGGTYCIWIENTTVWFVVRNCKVWNATSEASEPRGTGIYLKNVTHGTLMNNNCTYNSLGICLMSSSNNNITNNNCSGNSYDGIVLGSSTNNNITNNICSGNSWGGIDLLDSSNNNITNNNCSGNSYDGILLHSSTNNNITNNTLWNNGIVIWGDSLEYWDTHIIKNNTVNGKQVYYYKNQNGGTVPSDAGQVILANCTNMVVSGLTLTHASLGVQLGFSSYNNITNNSCSGNSHDGIYLWYSSNNNITNNNCSGNGAGIYLEYSSNNNITNNNCSGNSHYGIRLYSSSNYNNITNNICSGNSWYGLHLYYSSSNNITNNDFYHNTQYGIYITYYSKGNIIHHNNFWQNNGAGKGVNGNCQAYDDVGSNTWYDNTAHEGNYWSNWDGNGRGTPNAYPIAGSAGAYDMYPLSNPTPELSPLAVIVCALGLLYIAALRKRK
jgi:parallel beta-helix repeat protein